MYVGMYLCIHVGCIYIYMLVFIDVCMHACTYECMCIYVGRYECLYACMCPCML
eukprot:NODE_16364_length_181_cov_0.772727_g14594_i0.p1 GENE.NODE_16364_length_181_cov_0.772727_g14594_i0~~NODE_16364_length_181_cov_0.772727_g14594_i0.p1  ORF type:complete len:54 (+),score=7.99 NODE_16364_length_181_cov_0.772727_g14594_i0:12-173(+)